MEQGALQHISFSQYSSYVKCPASWYFAKIKQAEEKQTWYIPIGKAVHSMVEKDLEMRAFESFSPGSLSAEEFFYPLIRKQMEIEPDTRLWLAGGSQEAPIAEKAALERVQYCYLKAIKFLDEIDVWAVEYDASGRLPGLAVELKAYVDIVGEHKKKGPVIVDWKSGTTKPNNFQLETYGALLWVGKSDIKSEYQGIDFHGKYEMLAPGGPNTRFVDLSDVNPSEVGNKYQEVYERMQAKLYMAKPGFNCRFCFHQENCIDNAGPIPRAVHYDTREEDGFIF